MRGAHMVEIFDSKTKNSSQISVSVTSGKADENLTKFMHRALALGAKRYLTPSEVVDLKDMGNTFGLPPKTIDDVIQTIFANNPITVKELTQKLNELVGLKGEQAQLIMNTRNKTSLLQDQPHAASLKNDGIDGSTLPGEHEVGNQAILDAQYQSSISGLQKDVDGLKKDTGGDGTFNKTMKKQKLQEKHLEIKTDKTTVPLGPLSKKFYYDR